MGKNRSTTSIYNDQVDLWTRRDKSLLSDFTARPRLLEVLQPLEGAHLLDLGCGEGYVARLVAAEGAASVFGVDISEKMIESARAAAPSAGDCAMEFTVGDVSAGLHPPREHFNRIAAVFLFNYLDRAQMTAVLRLARERLAPGGRFVFTVPHPCFPYMRAPAEPFFFETLGEDYFSAVDQTFEGKIWSVEGDQASVRCVHKTVADYFDAIRAAGWSAIPRVEELRVTSEHIRLAPRFLEPLVGLPLHMLFILEEQR